MEEMKYSRTLIEDFFKNKHWVKITFDNDIVTLVSLSKQLDIEDFTQFIVSPHSSIPKRLIKGIVLDIVMFLYKNTELTYYTSSLFAFCLDKIKLYLRGETPFEELFEIIHIDINGDDNLEIIEQLIVIVSGIPGFHDEVAHLTDVVFETFKSLDTNFDNLKNTIFNKVFL